MGVELCSPDVGQPFATVRNSPQPFATVRNRLQPSATVRHMAVPMVSSAKGVTFRIFQLRVASFRVAGVALCDIPTCFMTCQKWFCVAGAILLPRFQKMRCFFMAGATLWRPPMSFCVTGATLKTCRVVSF